MWIRPCNPLALGPQRHCGRTAASCSTVRSINQHWLLLLYDTMTMSLLHFTKRTIQYCPDSIDRSTTSIISLNVDQLPKQPHYCVLCCTTRRSCKTKSQCCCRVSGGVWCVTRECSRPCEGCWPCSCPPSHPPPTANCLATPSLCSAAQLVGSVKSWAAQGKS